MPDHDPSRPALHDLLRQRTPRVPLTQLLIAINLLAFLASLAGGAGWWHSSNGVQLAWGANFGPATQDGQWWRLASALFLHFGVLHLAFNMWALWDGGQLVERMFGSLRFALIYFASGLAGNLLSLVVHGGQAVSGGASGAIFGIYGALLIFLWNERQNLHAHEFRWLFWTALGFSAVTIVFGMLISGIDNSAHCGGLVSGLLCGVILRRPLTARQRQPRRDRLLASGALVLAIAALISRIPAPAYRWSEEVLARKEIGQFLRDDQAISREWQAIINESRRRGASFDELAGRIDSAVSERYEASFEQLARLPTDSALPSSPTLERLRHYAGQRRDVSRALADGLRAKDYAQIREALEQAQRSASPTGATAQQKQ
jgi:rhomboid protease GluP